MSDNSVVTEDTLEQLSHPIEYKWRRQGKPRGNKLAYVAYIDSRQVQSCLDKVVGPANWQNKFETIGNKLYCSLGIKINGEWVWKVDCGTESEFEAEKGQTSDAFKRAAVHWGIGRFLYSLDITWISINSEGKPIDKSGKIIYDISDYISNLPANKKTKQTSIEILEEAYKLLNECNSVDVFEKVSKMHWPKWKTMLNDSHLDELTRFGTELKNALIQAAA
jgi:hypothetical protein